MLGREGGQRQFNHPEDGLLTFEQVAFTLAGRPGFKLIILVGPSKAAAAAKARRKRSKSG